MVKMLRSSKLTRIVTFLRKNHIKYYGYVSCVNYSVKYPLNQLMKNVFMNRTNHFITRNNWNSNF